jgi:choline dehydrogenase-like flavoprotein
MLIDGRLVPNGGTLRAEVAIIGAGPAGITVAQRLADVGISVLLLEGGGRHHTRQDDDALRGIGTGTPFPLVGSRRRGFGGTSLHWTPATGLRLRPLDTIDFVARSFRPGAAWPFGQADLEPYYDRAHASLGLENGYDPARYALDGDTTPLSWDGGPELAIFRFAPHDAYVRRYDEMVDHRHVDVALHSTVREIVQSEDGAVSSLTVVAPDGNIFHVRPNVVVLAAGGIDNARVLLASPGRHGNGVGNEHDNVGRYFMDHLSVDSGVIVPAAGRTIDVSAFGEHRHGADHYQPMLWLGPEVIEREGLPNAAFWVNELDSAYLSAGVGAARSLRASLRLAPRADVGRHATATLRGAPGLAQWAWRRAVGRSPRTVLSLRTMTEQIPDRDSRITLSSERDGLGRPRVQLDWRVSERDLAVVRQHQDVLARMLEEHGIGTVAERFEPASHPSPVMSNYHHIGATRMSVDPRSGVVDADSRVHTVSNLFVAGCSVFPTGGYLNPTLTIIALACRLADRIERDLRPTPVEPVTG